MRTFLKANWENIIMANYKVPKELLLPYLPKGVSLDLYKGEAYVSLVGFSFSNTKLFSIRIPYFGDFEEINLRFYVIREINGVKRRGVVFINETVPYKIVAFIANLLYHEKYIAASTKHDWKISSDWKSILYEWKLNKNWYSIKVKAENKELPIEPESFEEFIFEHYYGYTKVNANQSEEYRIYHPKWKINRIKDYNINCNFEKMYGSDFEFLNRHHAHSVFLAIGSGIRIDWKRENF
jgi:hypothetical protein